MQESLKTQTIFGLIWTSVNKFGTSIISFVSNIVLARLLLPSDYGCVGMLAIFISLADTFIDGGFGAALMQKTNPTDKDYSTMFYWNLFVALFLYGLLFVFAPFIASFYNVELLKKILRIQGITLIVSAFGMVQRNQVRKQLKFKTIAYINLIASFVAVMSAIVFAYCGFGVWSLVMQRLVSDAVTTLLFCFNNRWKPSMSFSKQSFKELFGFGSFLLMSNLTNKFFGNIEGVLIGKFFNPVTMGLYSQAGRVENVSYHTMTSVIEQVAYPVLAKVKDNRNDLINAMRKFKMAVAYVAFPILIYLIVVAKPLFLFLFTEKWIGSVPFFQIMCVGGIAMCIQTINYYVIMSLGKSKAIFLTSLLRRLLGLCLIFSGYYAAGIWGLLVGSVFTSYLISYTNSKLVSKYLNYGIFTQIKDLLPTLLVALISAITTYFFEIKVNLDPLLMLLISLCIYMLTYLLLSLVFRIESFLYIKQIIIDKYNKKSL